MKYKVFAFGKWLLLGLFVLIAGFCYRGKAAPPQEDLLPELVTEEHLLTEPETTSYPSLQPESEPVLYVHVCGQVISPGVYCVKQGQRIYEAIEMAGGFTEEAENAFLNLALELEDGMQIYVPKVGEKATGVESPEEKSPSKVNLNTASKETLMTLPGIGQAKAEAIIRYREQKGGFSEIQDIMEISGIKDAAFQKIKDDITV